MPLPYPSGERPCLPAADVQAVTFNVTRHGGYDERVLDEVLDHYTDELDKMVNDPSRTVASMTVTRCRMIASCSSR
jgi:hypothetical protein